MTLKQGKTSPCEVTQVSESQKHLYERKDNSSSFLCKYFCDTKDNPFYQQLSNIILNSLSFRDGFNGNLQIPFIRQYLSDLSFSESEKDFIFAIIQEVNQSIEKRKDK